jgi:hypothetical protein
LVATRDNLRNCNISILERFQFSNGALDSVIAALGRLVDASRHSVVLQRS